MQAYSSDRLFTGVNAGKEVRVLLGITIMNFSFVTRHSAKKFNKSRIIQLNSFHWICRPHPTDHTLPLATAAPTQRIEKNYNGLYTFVCLSNRYVLKVLLLGRRRQSVAVTVYDNTLFRNSIRYGCRVIVNCRV